MDGRWVACSPSHSRRLERRYRKLKKPCDRLPWIQTERNKHQVNLHRLLQQRILVAPMQFLFVQSSPFSTPRHVLFLTNGNMTILRHKFHISCTGYRWNDLITNFATSSTNAFIKVYHRTYSCVFVLVRSRVVVIFAQQPVVTWLFRAKLIKRIYWPHSFTVYGSALSNSLSLSARYLELTLPAWHILLKT